MERDSRVIDGMYWRKLGGLVLERADTVVWVDLPWLPMCEQRLARHEFAHLELKCFRSTPDALRWVESTAAAGRDA